MSYKEKLKPSAAYKKRVLLIFNLLFLIVGICMMSVGLYLTMYPLKNYGEEKTTTYEYFFDVRFFSVVDMLYTVGIIMSTISFLGFVGAFSECIFILLLFSVCLAMAFVLEVTFAATGYIMREQIKENLTNSMKIMMHEYGTNAASKRTVDTIQKVLGCCGVNSCQEWERDFHSESEVFGQYVHFHNSYISFDECRVNSTDGSYRLKLPTSCCGKTDDYGRCLGISKHGCIPQLGFLVQNNYISIAGLAVAVAIVQITGIVFACMLVKALYIQKNKHGKKYSLLQEELIRNDY